MVADASGAEDSGQRVSTVAVDAVTQYLLNVLRIAERASVGNRLFETRLLEALEHCQKATRREGEVIEFHHGMAAEVTVAYVLWSDLYVVQAAKASCSLLRDGVLSDVGRATPAEIVGGASGKSSPVFSNVRIRLGGRLLVCSDSVRKPLDDFRITSMVSRQERAASICRELAEAARLNGCNEATVVVACFDDRVRPDMESQVHAVSVGDAEAQESKNEQAPLTASASTLDRAGRGAEPQGACAMADRGASRLFAERSLRLEHTAETRLILRFSTFGMLAALVDLSNERKELCFVV